jgi:hypothetical protein
MHRVAVCQQHESTLRQYAADIDSGNGCGRIFAFNQSGISYRQPVAFSEPDASGRRNVAPNGEPNASCHDFNACPQPNAHSHRPNRCSDNYPLTRQVRIEYSGLARSFEPRRP